MHVRHLSERFAASHHVDSRDSTMSMLTQSLVMKARIEL